MRTDTRQNSISRNLSGLCLSLAVSVAPFSASADPCGAVSRYIAFGKMAEKCVVKMQINQDSATSVLNHFGYCTTVRDARNEVEGQVKNMPISIINTCAEKNLDAYTQAALSFHRLSQYEIHLK